MKRVIDFHADLGLGFGPWTVGDAADEALLPLLGSASVAAGFHAGDPGTMERTVRAARAHGVGVGVQAGFPDRVGLGRRHLNAPPAEIVNDVLYQVGALREFARLHGVRLQHLTLQGALALHAARDEATSRALVLALQAVDPALTLYCPGASVTWRVARELGHPATRVFFADRDYDAAGCVVLARRVGRMDATLVADRVLRACREQRVRAIDGTDLPMAFDSVCLHGDTPGVLALARAVRSALADAGVRIAPLAQVLEPPDD